MPLRRASAGSNLVGIIIAAKRAALAHNAVSYVSCCLNDQWPPKCRSIQVVGNIVEHDVDLVAQMAVGADRGDGDKRRDQCIFDRIGAALAAKKFC